MCVLNGGKLIQDCNNHAIHYTHGIKNSGEMVYQITSTHHQMQYPFCLPKEYYKILYTTEYNISEYYDGDGIEHKNLIRFGEPEVVLYNTPNFPKCLAIQGHPEMMSNSPVAKMLSDLIYTYLNKKDHE